MSPNHNRRIGIIFIHSMLLLTLFTPIVETRADTPLGQKGPGMMEKTLLRELELNEDVNDSEIVGLLDRPDKRTSAVILLIRYRKIHAATPKLIEIFNEEKINGKKISIFDKRWAAEALCDFGNRDWVPMIKAMAEDPNSKINRDMSLKYDVAGLLARAGDFSQFDVVVKGLSDERDFIRHKAMLELRKFAHPTDPVTDKAAELLVAFAKSEPNNNFRGYAIEGLEKLAKVKPSLKQKVIEALEANVNSPDKDLRTISNIKLKAYKKPAEPNQ